jgi:hypothetical protein
MKEDHDLPVVHQGWTGLRRRVRKIAEQRSVRELPGGYCLASVKAGRMVVLAGSRVHVQGHPTDRFAIDFDVKRLDRRMPQFLGNGYEGEAKQLAVEAEKGLLYRAVLEVRTQEWCVEAQALRLDALLVVQQLPNPIV